MGPPGGFRAAFKRVKEGLAAERSRKQDEKANENARLEGITQSELEGQQKLESRPDTWTGHDPTPGLDQKWTEQELESRAGHGDNHTWPDLPAVGAGWFPKSFRDMGIAKIPTLTKLGTDETCCETSSHDATHATTRRTVCGEFDWTEVKKQPLQIYRETDRRGVITAKALPWYENTVDWTHLLPRPHHIATI